MKSNNQIFLVRQVESWLYDECWTYNNVWNIGRFSTKATKTETEKKALTRFLKKNGIVFKKNKTRIEFDGDIYQIVDRKTKEILFDCIPEY